jgi:hypothetical protein
MKRLLLTALLLFSTVGAYAESVAIVVDKDCKLEELSLAELRAILHCEKLLSPNKAKWIVVLRPKTSPEHQAMLKTVFKCTADELESYFRLGEFNGSIDPTPKLIPSPVLVRRIVAGNVSAIGYVRTSDIADNVKALRIDGALPADGNYPIKTAE